MRITPIAILCSQVKNETLREKIIRSEISLTHGNETIQQAGIFYCKVISDLINYLDPETAYNNALYLRFNMIDPGVLVTEMMSLKNGLTA